MTILVAARTLSGETWIGADRAAFQGDTHIPVDWRKWDAVTDGAGNVVWYAVSGDAAGARLLGRRLLAMVDRGRSSPVTLTPDLIGALQIEAIAELSERNKQVGDNASPGTLIAVINGTIYSYDKLGAWDEHTTFMASGSGREHALGALYALTQHHPISTLSGSLLVGTAVRAACEFNAWCRGCWVQKVWG